MIKLIISCPLIFISFMAFGQTHDMFNDLYDGLEQRKLLLRYEIRNIQQHFESNDHITNKQFTIKRLNAIANNVEKISTNNENKHYIKNKIKNIIRALNNQTKVAKSVPTNEIQKINTIQSSNILQAPKPSPLAKELTDELKPESRNAFSDYGQYFVYLTPSFVLTILLFFVLRRKKALSSPPALPVETNAQKNQNQELSLRKLLSFYTNTMTVPALVCQENGTIKWANDLCHDQIDLRAEDIFNFERETFSSNGSKYIKVLELTYLVQFKKVKGLTLYFFIEVDLAPLVRSKHELSDIQTTGNEVIENEVIENKQAPCLDETLRHYQELFQEINTTFKVEHIRHDIKLNELNNTHSQENLNVLHSFLNACISSIKSSLSDEAIIRLKIDQSSQTFTLNFVMRNICFKTLKTDFSKAQKYLQNEVVTCSFFQNSNCIKANIVLVDAAKKCQRQETI